MNVIEVSQVIKSYGKVEALKGVSLTVESGKIFALIGPNGAGKTTLIKCLLGLLKPQSGHLTIKGINCLFPSSRRHIAYLPEKFNFFPYYEVKKALQFFGELHGLASEEIPARLENALAHLNIHELRLRKIKTLSKGQLQRLGLASLLMSNAEILLMDEPMTGLDPIGIKELKDLMLKLKGQGKTIFLNTHILSEVEQICDSVAIVHQGKMLASGDIKELTKEMKLEDYFYQLVKGAN